MQLENSHDLAITIKKYQEIIFAKTAILFSASCQISAIISNQNKIITDSLANFGKNLGILFQIIDDILDYSGDKNIMGKKIGDDFFEAKVTLPIIYSYQNANDSDKELICQKFQYNLENNNKNHQDFDDILKLINQYHGIDLSILLAKKYYQLAKDDLKIFSDNPYYSDFISILDYSLQRIS
jgi:octaprenyl-diphosphate synthase